MQASSISGYLHETARSHFFKYYADNIKFKLGEPEVINNGKFSDLLIPVEIWFDNVPELVSHLSTFIKKPSVSYDSYIKLETWHFKGPKSYEIDSHFSRYKPQLVIVADKYSRRFDLLTYGSWLDIKRNVTMGILNIPTSELSLIGSIDAKVVCDISKPINDSNPSPASVRSSSRKKKKI